MTLVSAVGILTSGVCGDSKVRLAATPKSYLFKLATCMKILVINL